MNAINYSSVLLVSSKAQHCKYHDTVKRNIPQHPKPVTNK